jgi:hypothetical protein
MEKMISVKERKKENRIQNHAKNQKKRAKTLKINSNKKRSC